MAISLRSGVQSTTQIVGTNTNESSNTAASSAAPTSTAAAIVASPQQATAISNAVSNAIAQMGAKGTNAQYVSDIINNLEASGQFTSDEITYLTNNGVLAGITTGIFENAHGGNTAYDMTNAPQLLSQLDLYLQNPNPLGGSPNPTTVGTTTAVSSSTSSSLPLVNSLLGELSALQGTAATNSSTATPQPTPSYPLYTGGGDGSSSSSGGNSSLGLVLIALAVGGGIYYYSKHHKKTSE